MNEYLLQLFSTYKSSNYYNTSNVDIDFVWLKEKLDDNDYDELEKQTLTILLNSEEEIFMGCFKFAWGLFQELCNNNTPYED